MVKHFITWQLRIDFVPNLQTFMVSVTKAVCSKYYILIQFVYKIMSFPRICVMCIDSVKINSFTFSVFVNHMP